MGGDNWFYRLGNEQKGPVSTQQIEALEQAGIIRPDTLVWQEGMAEWMPALQTALSDLFKEWKRQPPPFPKGEPTQSAPSWSNPQIPEEAPRAYQTGAKMDERGVQRIPSSLFKWTTGALQANFFFSIMSAVVYFRVFGEGSTRSVENSLEILEHPILALIELSILIFGIVFYMIWLFRNLKFYNQELPVARRLSPTWIVWSHFIPFLWFWMPFFAVRMIKNGAKQRYPECAGNYGSPVLWWVLTWVGILFELMAIAAMDTGKTMGSWEDLKAGIFLQGAVYALAAGTSLILMRIVEDSHKALYPHLRQEKAHA